MALSHTEKIRDLNDSFRRTQLGGMTLVTSGISALPPETRAAILKAIREFTDFDEGNDPYHEHDFLAVDVDGVRVFAKIEYFDLDMRYGADDPSDPARTKRVMTIMRSDEY